MPDCGKPRTTARVSTKGQVILPKAVRERQGWGPGTVLQIEDGADGVTLRVAKPRRPVRLDDIAGKLGYEGPPISIEDMHTAVDAEIRRRYAGG